jgi:hypothetical protein
VSALSRVAAILVPIALILAGCGSKDPETSAPASETTAPSQAPMTSAENSTSAAQAPEAGVAGAAEPQAAPATEKAPSATPRSATPESAGASSRAATAAPASGSAMAPMPGIVTRQTELKAEPALGAKTLGSLAAKTPVTITARQGGWLQVTSGDARGWVRLLHVSSQPSARTSGAREELEAAARVATGRAGSGNIAVTTGIRGLDEEELREAQPNPEELKRLESLGADPADAQNHAKRRGLERRQVPYPPPPQTR